MDALRFKVLYGVRIGGKVPNRRTADNPECLAGLHTFLQLDRLCVDNVAVFAEGEVVSPLGLCSEIKFSLRFPLNGFCEAEQVTWLTLFQFQFQLFDRARATPDDEFTPINSKFDLASPGPDWHGGAMNRSFKDRLELSPKTFRREAFQRGPANLAEIGCIALDFGFPFSAAELCARSTLDCLDIFVARLPNAKRESMPP